MKTQEFQLEFHWGFGTTKGLRQNNIDKDLWRHMGSLGHNGLIIALVYI